MTNTNNIVPTKEIKAKAIALGKELQKLGSGYFRRLKINDNTTEPSDWVVSVTFSGIYLWHSIGAFNEDKDTCFIIK